MFELYKDEYVRGILLNYVWMLSSLSVDILNRLDFHISVYLDCCYKHTEVTLTLFQLNCSTGRSVDKSTVELRLKLAKKIVPHKSRQHYRRNQNSLRVRTCQPSPMHPCWTILIGIQFSLLGKTPILDW